MSRSASAWPALKPFGDIMSGAVRLMVELDDAHLDALMAEITRLTEVNCPWQIYLAGQVLKSEIVATVAKRLRENIQRAQAADAAAAIAAPGTPKSSHSG